MTTIKCSGNYNLNDEGKVKISTNPIFSQDFRVKSVIII